MEDTITIQTVKEQIDIETNELIGYLVDGNISVPLDEGNRHYQEVQQWIAEDGIIEPQYTPEELEDIHAAKVLAEWKASRAEAVANIKVTVNGKVFDGDEDSQMKMTRAFSAMGDTDSTLWKLADNSVVFVSKDELKSAVKLSGEEQTRLWFSPEELTSV